MASHLRSIVENCTTCGKPAQFMLYSTVNAPSGRYCRKHALPALRAWRARHGEPVPTKEDMPA